jgi:hypothetical protein
VTLSSYLLVKYFFKSSHHCLVNKSQSLFSKILHLSNYQSVLHNLVWATKAKEWVLKKKKKKKKKPPKLIAVCERALQCSKKY